MSLEDIQDIYDLWNGFDSGGDGRVGGGSGGGIFDFDAGLIDRSYVYAPPDFPVSWTPSPDPFSLYDWSVPRYPDYSQPPTFQPPGPYTPPSSVCICPSCDGTLPVPTPPRPTRPPSGGTGGTGGGFNLPPNTPKPNQQQQQGQAGGFPWLLIILVVGVVYAVKES